MLRTFPLNPGSLTCPDCGGDVPTEAGFCPHCLLRDGLELPELDTSGYTTEHFIEGRESEGLESRLMGRYKLGTKLGEGGLGVIFEARQLQPVQRVVAVKVLKTGRPAAEIIARFQSWHVAFQPLQHRGVACVLDAGETQDGRAFLVTESSKGMPLTAWIRQRNPPLRERVSLFLSVCAAVQHAHEKGILHRDLKPSNIRIVEEDGQTYGKVIDFGLATLLATPLNPQALCTLPDQVIGMPGYIAPEHLGRGIEVVDVRGEVYALGAVLHEVLTGTPLLEQKTLIGQSLEAALREASRQPLERPSEGHPQLRGELDMLLLRALAHDPAQRYETVAALSADLQRYLDKRPLLAHPPSLVYEGKKGVQRHPLLASLGLLLVIAVAAVAGDAWWKGQRWQQIAAEQRRDSSRRHVEEAERLSESGHFIHSIPLLCQALREDPQHPTAATSLTALLSQHDPGRQESLRLALKPGWPRVRQVTVHAARGLLAAVCAATETDRPDIILRWRLDDSRSPPFELSLPLGMKVSACLGSPDDAALMLGFHDGTVARYELESDLFSPFAERMDSAVTALAMDAMGTHLVVGSASGQVRDWEVVKQAPTSAGQHVEGAVTHLAVDAMAQHAIAVSTGAVTRLTRERAQPFAMPNHRAEATITSVAMAPQGHVFAIGFSSGEVHLLRGADGTSLGPTLPHRGSITALAFDPSGNALFSGDVHGHGAAWEVREARPAGPGMRLGAAVRGCRALMHQQAVMTVTEAGEMRVWQPQGHRLSTVLGSPPISAAAISQDGSLAALVSESRHVLDVWRLPTRLWQPRAWAGPVPAATRHVASQRSPVSEAWTLQGNQIDVRVRHGREVELIERSNGRVLSLLRHEIDVQHLLLSHDERTLITLTEDGTHQAWDVRSGQPLIPAFHAAEAATAVRLTAEGRHYLVQGPTGEWSELPLPQRVEKLPSWFLDFAEARAKEPWSQQSQGIARPIGTDPASVLADWLCQPRDRRPLWPTW